jgi:hypothetical protein
MLTVENGNQTDNLMENIAVFPIRNFLIGIYNI